MKTFLAVKRHVWLYSDLLQALNFNLKGNTSELWALNREFLHPQFATAGKRIKPDGFWGKTLKTGIQRKMNVLHASFFLCGLSLTVTHSTIANSFCGEFFLQANAGLHGEFLLVSYTLCWSMCGVSLCTPCLFMQGVSYVSGAGFLLQGVSPGSVFTGNFQYFTCYDQQILETKAAISHSIRILFCLTSSQIFFLINSAQRERERDRESGVCPCVYMLYVCVWDRKGNMMLACTALVVVSINGSVSDRLRWLSHQFLWTTFVTLQMSPPVWKNVQHDHCSVFSYTV